MSHEVIMASGTDSCVSNLYDQPRAFHAATAVPMTSHLNFVASVDLGLELTGKRGNSMAKLLIIF
jgi:hypothetical protein